MSTRSAGRRWVALAACLLAASARADDPAAGVRVGVAGHYRSGSWTPLVVTGARSGDMLHVAVQDPDGAFVRSPPTRAGADAGSARFGVRFGRPAGRVRIENLTSGDRADLDLPPPLPATRSVLLLVGNLPALGRTARLLADTAAARPAVVEFAAATNAAADSARDFDGIDTVVACGAAVVTCDPLVLSGIDAWVRDGGRLVLAAGRSAQEVAARGGPAAAWLPGSVTETVPLRRVAAIETYARAAGLAARPAADDLRVPLLANRLALAASIEVFEGTVATDLPLVVRRAHGFGTVTWVGLDLDAEPFRGWSGTDTLLARLLGGRSVAAEPPATSGPPDLAGQLRVALEAPGPDGGLAPVPFALVAGLGLLYVACIFPLDWWLVTRSGRPWIAWLSLPALVAFFTAAVWTAADRRGPDAAPQARSAEVIDVDAVAGQVRGRSWLAVWRRENVAVNVTAAVAAGGEVAVSWLADAGPGFGGIDAAVPHPTLAVADYGYGDSLAALVRVPVAAESSRLFEARWSGTTAHSVSSDLFADAQGTLRGGFAHRLPFPLTGCRLAHGGWVYDVGDLAPGQRHDLANGRGPRSLAGELTRRGTVQEREGTPRWDRGGRDLARILEVAGFHEAAGGSGYTGLPPGRLAGLDLSPLLPLDRAVLLGTATAPLAGWTTDWRVADAGGPATGPSPCGGRLYRIVIPLGAAPAAGRAAGADSE